ncbi:hypothetical protein [Pseudomonas aeruginosa]|uniref:hypothetical protein n=1 Tax=Pseudomonas aeruginosa TaxID=287 RepID=UPI003983A5D7
MSVMDLLRGFTSKAVIVDDGYAEIDMSMIDGGDFQEFYEYVLADGRWERLKQDVFTGFPDLEPEDLIGHEEAIRAAWNFYHSASSHNHPCLDIVFRQLLATVGVKISPLKPLVSFLENDLGLQVKRYSSVEAASDEIKTCCLVFLDFYLSKIPAEEVLQNIEKHKDLLSSRVEGDNSLRFVYLMSTQLPQNSILERFRRITNLRAALFSPVEKELLQPEWIQAELAARVYRYRDIVRVEEFLQAFAEAITSSAESLLNDISALELHDLSILNSMRLYKEQESYAEYLGWLFSEALSAKIRNSNSLAGAARGVNDIQLTPFSGMLEPRSLLFKLYSEIAFSYLEEDGARQVHFGDIYYPKSLARSLKKSDLAQRLKTKESDVRSWGDIRRRERMDNLALAKSRASSEQVFLVISPACDLIRCPSVDYQVTCVRGFIEHSTPRLADLFDQGYLFGENKHLMRLQEKGREEYALINWTPKDIVTIPIDRIRDKSLFGKRARMNELFCHELKEEALRVLGRVGVPVDPSFSIPLGAAFRFKDGKGYKLLVAPSNAFISAIRVAGNKLNDRKIVFTAEFKQWFGREVRAICGDSVPKSVASVVSYFEQSSSVEYTVRKQDPTLVSGQGKLIYLERYSEESCTHELALYVYPWSEYV